VPAGYTAQPFESDYPNIEYGQFIKDCVRDMAGALDVAYIINNSVVKPLFILLKNSKPQVENHCYA
jgi:hypothetical protein